MSQQFLLSNPFPLRERIGRRARCVRIEVRPSGEVLLTIPYRTSRAEAYAFLDRRRDWIERTRSRLAARVSSHPALCWDGSDQLPVRGHLLRIEVATAPLRKAVVRIQQDRILLCVPPSRLADSRYLQDQLLSALRDEARREAEQWLEEESRRLGLPYASLSIRDQKTRWGSCTRQGRISLNWRLVMAPREVFRYVVVHELCHLRWLSHGPRFWGLVARQMPDYQFHRAWLRRHGDELHGRLRD
jgi:predicted metal-dependent hydrolase